MASGPSTGGSPTGGAPRGRGRPVGHAGQDTRAAILRAAQRLFGESGYAGVSMDALAVACGLNARALYYHFPSKRALFAAASEEAFVRFGDEVVARVFRCDDVAGRVAGYVDVYRALHASDPHVVPFIGVVLLDALAAPPDHEPDPSAAGSALQAFLETVVDQAMARGEVHERLDRDGAVLLLRAMGMGLALASLHDTGAYPAMLDAVDLLAEGRLFTDPTG